MSKLLTQHGLALFMLVYLFLFIEILLVLHTSYNLDRNRIIKQVPTALTNAWTILYLIKPLASFWSVGADTEFHWVSNPVPCDVHP